MKILVVWAIYAIAINLLLWRAGRRLPNTSNENLPEQKPKRILIIGSTGGTGRRLVEQALERGYTVTAMARNPAKLGIEHPKLSIVHGDVLDYESVAAAVKGHDAVVSALGHKRFFSRPAFFRTAREISSRRCGPTVSGVLCARRRLGSVTPPGAWASCTLSS